MSPGLAAGRRDGSEEDEGGIVARVGLPGIATGVVVSLALSPEQMLADQHLALDRMVRAAALAPGVEAVGLGSLCAVVAGRGLELAERLPVPVTTGGAATAWALHRNTRALLRGLGRPRGPVAVVGSSSPVGHAVATLLASEGVAVRVDHKRGGRGLDVTVAEGPDDCVAGVPVVVGAGPTGGTVSPQALAPNAVIVDVALPGTVRGPLPAGCVLLAGEAVVCPPEWSRRVWGRFYQVFAGYGPRQVFACLIEPLVLVATDRDRPFALGRRLPVDDVRAFGEAAESLGFRPRLARGWRGVDPGTVGQQVAASGRSTG